MENLNESFLKTFDQLFTNNHIQILKLMVPLLDVQMQKKLCIYIKYLELQQAFSIIKEKPYPMCSLFQVDKPDIKSTCKSILPLCEEKEQKKIKDMLNLLNALDIINEMNDMMDIFGGNSPFTPNSTDEGNNFDIMSMLTSMLSPEQQEIMKQMEALNE